MSVTSSYGLHPSNHYMVVLSFYEYGQTCTAQATTLAPYFSLSSYIHQPSLDYYILQSTTYLIIINLTTLDRFILIRNDYQPFFYFNSYLGLGTRPLCN